LLLIKDSRLPVEIRNLVLAKIKLTSNPLSLFSAFGVYLKYYRVRYQSNAMNADDHESNKGKIISPSLERYKSNFDQGLESCL